MLNLQVEQTAEYCRLQMYVGTHKFVCFQLIVNKMRLVELIND